MSDVETRMKALARSWGVEAGDTLSVTLVGLMEHLHEQQAVINKLLQEIHAEQTKMWSQLRRNDGIGVPKPRGKPVVLEKETGRKK